MTINGIAHPQHLSMLSKVLSDYFTKHDIEVGSLEAENVAIVLYSYFQSGTNTEQALTEALERQRSLRGIR